MKSTIRRIVFVLFFLLLHSPLCSAAVLNDVPEVQQERDKWCWAACSQATLSYYGVSVSQCAIANFARSQNDWGNDDCCANQHGDICNQENDLYGSAGSFQDILENWGVKSDERRYPLSQSAISSEINARRPFVIEWAWNTGGGHFLVGRGIEDNLVHYMDPWPGNGYQLASYEWVVEGSEHEWTDSLQITTNVLYTLTLRIDPPGGGSISSYSHGSHSYGEQVKLTASPNAGYAFSNWSGDAAGSANPVTITMDGNKSVTANFTLVQYTLTLYNDPPDGGSILSNSHGSHSYGEQVKLTASPNAGCVFSNWSGDAAGSANPVTITMDGNKSVTANFKYTLTLDIDPPGGGTISSYSPNSHGSYSYGEQVELTASPNAGYAFSNWSGDAAGSANPVTIAMDGNKSVTANFTLLNIVGDVNGDGEVTIGDLQAWVNHFLCLQDWGSAADVNGDGFVDPADLQTIINIILGPE